MVRFQWAKSAQPSGICVGGCVPGVARPPARRSNRATDIGGPGVCASSAGPYVVHVTARRLKVLLVEDDPDSRELLAEVLAMEHDVVTAADGQEGLVTFVRERPDVIVTDETLPGLRGTELARRARGLRPEVKILLVSGHASIPGAEACDRVLRKPLDIDDLLRTLIDVFEEPRVGSDA